MFNGPLIFTAALAFPIVVVSELTTLTFTGPKNVVVLLALPMFVGPAPLAFAFKVPTIAVVLEALPNDVAAEPDVLIDVAVLALMAPAELIVKRLVPLVIKLNVLLSFVPKDKVEAL